MDSISDSLASMPAVVQIGLAAVGAAYVLSKLWNFACFILNVFILSGTNLRKYGPKGTWAVVTGASDGLGKEFATQLAAKGFNLVLVSRTQSKLASLSSELENKFPGVNTQILALDYSQPTEADYNRLAKVVLGLDVGILINNVGQSHSIPVPFLKTETEELENIIKINCLGTLRTTQIIAPGMVARKRGLILTMGSFSGFMPIPLLATYSGSKVFLQHWSTALAAELKPSNVDVELSMGYLIVSAMSKVRRPSLLIPNAKPWVRSALGKIGRGSQAYAHTVTPWWSHAIMLWAVENFVGVGSKLGLWFNLKSHEDIRQRALRKAAREAKKA